MNNFKIHTIETAPEKSKGQLENSLKAFGMIPNLHAVMAESPAILEAYTTLHRLFSQETSFNAEELTVIWQSINVENECHYCVPAHTGIAYSMKVDNNIIQALRDEAPLEDQKLEVLRTTTLRIVRNRGILNENELLEFYNAGYTQQQLLEIILGYSQKILSNYTNHVAETPVDNAFKKFSWEKVAQ
ncbi:carboxymuconolactone decarboxylase family protein [Flammeovirga aprica]|uniref:Carboxymuconolactone decarboxylase family protein n=1 Tax=Flammeovirga aprica JL-4 TaxID=694437 RepID=A0A7X9XBK4_9BACT|nr:carboxymuconolactone decarboxylase family protein [Flammeovirga aprica]NME70724.1 carboxymuconolactone decarboxylase family protein [Flammeovirga aprica JL-4]